MTSDRLTRSVEPDPPPDLVPARMVNEYVYCPRLAYLEWVQGEFEHSSDTLEGRHQHRRVDRPGGRVPEPDENPETIHARSVHLSAPRLGLVAVIDLIELDAGADPGDTPEGARGGASLMPVDYKKGVVPDNPERSWEPDRVQIAVQGLILRENGYRVERGVLYYAASKTRVEVLIDDELVSRALDAVEGLRTTAAAGVIPAPLVDSPKCPRCSLVGICLPDETRLLAGTGEPPDPAAAGPDPSPRPDDGDPEPRVRTIIPTRDDTRCLYIQTQGAYVSKKGDRLQVHSPGRQDRLADVRLLETSQVSLFGNVQVSTQALQALCDSQIPVLYFSYGGWFRGITTGLPSRNIELRMKQFGSAGDPAVALDLARRFVAAKVENQRTLVRRNHPDPDREVLDHLKGYIEKARRASDTGSLLGIEGSAARLFFSQLPALLRPRESAERPVDTALDFENRNRRPPRDPVNALLSYGYSILAKDLTVTCWSIGLDPFLGYFHRPRYGRPALALDLMEEFRPLIVDSVVLSSINTGVVRSTDFLRRGPAVALTSDGRKKFLQAYERRMDSLITHPMFGYSISYRRVLEVQARILSRFLLGEIPHYEAFTTR